MPSTAVPWGEDAARAALASTYPLHGVRTADAVLIRLAMTAVFAAGGVALKVTPVTHRCLRSVVDEHAVIDHARAGGVPVPATLGVWSDARYVVAATELVPATDPLDWAALGASVATLHALPPPPGLASFTFGTARYQARIDTLTAAGTIIGAEAAVLSDWLATPDLPAGPATFVHGDLHTGNVIMSGGRAWLVDWEKACSGPAEVDLARPGVRAARFGLPARDVDAFTLGYGTAPAFDAALVAALDRISVVSGITYLLGSPGEIQQREGRRRLDDLMGGTQSVWADA